MDRLRACGLKIRAKHLVVGVYYRPPDQEEPVDEAFLLQLQKALHSGALNLLRDFNHLDVYWESHVVGSKQSRRLMESTEENVLVQLLDKPTRGEALLDLVLTSAEELNKRLRLEEA